MSDITHEMPGLKIVEDPTHPAVPRYFDLNKQKSEKVVEFVATAPDGDEKLALALKGELRAEEVPDVKTDQKSKAKPGRPRKARQEPVDQTASEGPAIGPTVLPKPAEDEDTGFIVTINTSFGVMLVNAYDIVIEPERKLFGICYDAKVRGNRFMPKPEVGRISLQVSKAGSDENEEYDVVPLGVQFKLPKDELLIVLFELAE